MDPDTTEHLLIESITAEHAAALYPVLDDDQIYRYVPTRRCESPEELAAQFAKWQAGPQNGESEVWLNWALRERSRGHFLGTLQATVLSDDSAWIGYLLGSRFWGLGYASEACRWLLCRLANDYGVKLARASVDSRNDRSIALLRRLDMLHASTETAELRGESTVDFHFTKALVPDP
jgi:RimJ/RimL family protein N-acetyltransferase